jgi:asparagine N-glycosylation enzyme membrane subunit Stt3
MILESFKKLDELKRNQIYLLLVGVVILGFSIRYLPFLHKLMMDDTYYQFSISKHILENGRAPQSLVLADFPKGRSIIKDPLLLPYFIAYSYKLIQPLGVSLSGYMVVFPAIFGALGAIPLYFLVERLFDRRMFM